MEAIFASNYWETATGDGLEKSKVAALPGPLRNEFASRSMAVIDSRKMPGITSAYICVLVIRLCPSWR